MNKLSFILAQTSGPKWYSNIMTSWSILYEDIRIFVVIAVAICLVVCGFMLFGPRQCSEEAKTKIIRTVFGAVLVLCAGEFSAYICNLLTF